MCKMASVRNASGRHKTNASAPSILRYDIWRQFTNMGQPALLWSWRLTCRLRAQPSLPLEPPFQRVRPRQPFPQEIVDQLLTGARRRPARGTVQGHR
jgi:hypothetical protein